MVLLAHVACFLIISVVLVYRISDASGQMQTTKVASGLLKRKMLDKDDVFLLDTGSELFVWVGKGATKAERRKGMKYGVKYLKKKGRPNWTPITRVPGGGETPVFKSYFKQWDPPRKIKISKKTEKKGQLSYKVLLVCVIVFCLMFGCVCRGQNRCFCSS